MNQNIFGKFSQNLKKALISAEKKAREEGVLMDTEHQLLALIETKGTLASEILTNFEATSERVQLVRTLVGGNNTPNQIGISSDAKKIIQKTVSIASSFSHTFVDCEHLLLALVSDKKYNSFLILERMGIKPNEIKKQIETIFGNIKETLKPINQGISQNDFLSDDQYEVENFGPMGQPGFTQTLQRKKESLLETYCINLTQKASEEKLDPVIGRDYETERLIQTLSRRTKNNPILVGDPGVGKTAIVEGLAHRLVSGQVPNTLIGKEIFSLDMGALIAGTMYRGQFESRVKKLLEEIKKKGNAIMFIDEIHTVVGAGSTEGSIDAANLLKPMLARGELRLIGSTTPDEYKKHIEKDAAFERRFQPVKVAEPSEEETIRILKGIKGRYEKHHKVSYTEGAILAAVVLSKRYLNDRFLPDKAIDLIDEAAAATNVVSEDTGRLVALKKELRDVLRQKDEYIVAEKYEAATLLREREIILENQIRKIKTKTISEKRKTITEEDVAALISKWTGIPASNLSIEEKKRYLTLGQRIKKRIVGQDEAVTEITRAIKRARVGIGNPNRPTGSFIFLGPTGVGKSELAKVLTREVFGSEKHLVKIDMSEFMEKHNVSRLVGAPAGYVGYEEGGKLTEVIRAHPYSLILLDEIEKAHPEVFNILLQVMEDGELTDAKGRRIDFKNTILIMTSNLGTDILNKQSAIGFNNLNSLDKNYEKLEANVKETVEKHFKPEFMNRLDKIIIFKPLSKDSIKKIAAIELKELKDRLHANGFNLEFDQPVVNWIAEKGYNPEFGARPLRRVIADHIENQITEAILSEKVQTGQKISLRLKENKIVIA